MAGSNFPNTYLPDGQVITPPVIPRTWVDQAPGVLGDPLRAKWLEHDVGGAVLWHRQRPLFQGIQTGTQSIPNNAWTTVTGLAAMIDNYAGFNDTGNTGRWFPPYTWTDSPGGDWYLCTGYLPWNTSDTTHVFVAGLRKNGSTFFEGNGLPSTPHSATPMVLDLVQLSARTSDYIELAGWQDSGGSVNTVTAGKCPSLTVRWVCMDPSNAGAATPALPAAPHVWATSDLVTGNATGGAKVPLNKEFRDVVNFLNNPPIARLTTQGTTQQIPSGGTTWTSFPFTTKSVDNYGGWSSTINPSRYTIQRAGTYLLAGMGAVSNPNPAGGYRAVRLLVNGTTAIPGQATVPQSGDPSSSALYAVKHLRLAANDYIEVQMQQTQGSSLNIVNTSNGAAKLIAVWMGL